MDQRQLQRINEQIVIVEKEIENYQQFLAALIQRKQELEDPEKG